jgi:hypothetical protein
MHSVHAEHDQQPNEESLEPQRWQRLVDCKRLALMLQGSLSAEMRGKTDRLCSDDMQYKATAD